MVNFYRCPLYLETTTSRSLSNSIYILSRINRVPYGNMIQLLRIIECPTVGTYGKGGTLGTYGADPDGYKDSVYLSELSTFCLQEYN